jgi:hypothetical protein
LEVGMGSLKIEAKAPKAPAPKIKTAEDYELEELEKMMA